MGTRTAMKLNLRQAILIQANGYQSKDMQTDYAQEEVERRILELLAAKDERTNSDLMKRFNTYLSELPPEFFPLDEGSDESLQIPEMEERYHLPSGAFVVIPSPIIPF